MYCEYKVPNCPVNPVRQLKAYPVYKTPGIIPHDHVLILAQFKSKKTFDHKLVYASVCTTIKQVAKTKRPASEL